MNAHLAYFQGLFNNCSFEWVDPTHCKITVHDSKTGKGGSFIAEYDEAKNVVKVADDQGMIEVNVLKITKPKPLNESSMPPLLSTDQPGGVINEH